MVWMLELVLAVVLVDNGVDLSVGLGISVGNGIGIDIVGNRFRCDIVMFVCYFNFFTFIITFYFVYPSFFPMFIIDMHIASFSP